MLKEIAQKNQLLRLIYHAFLSKNYLPKWSRLLANDEKLWKSKLESSGKRPKILIATAVGFQIHSINIESLLAVALTLRGADVHILLCDSALPACFTSHVTKCRNWNTAIVNGLSKEYCRYCFPPAHKMYRSLGLPIHFLGNFIKPKEMIKADLLSADVPTAEINNYLLDGVAVGEHAAAGALRFYSRGSFDGEPYAEPVLRQYLKSSIITTFAMRRLLGEFQYDCAVFSHGIYVPHGLIGEVCRKEGVRVVNWNPGYRKKSFIFSHHNTYHKTMMDEPVDKWINIVWDKRLESNLVNYLKSRWTGKEDWIWFSDASAESDPAKIIKILGIDKSKPSVGLLTNVVWDAQLHYPQNVFANMLEWLFETIVYFKKRQDLQLIIRIHPAEIKGAIPSRQKVLNEIRKAFGQIPGNVFIIPPESRISTYAAMSICDSVIIYGTKMGTELTNMGIPVIVAGEAWIRNKGLTIDVSSKEDYFRLLEKLPLRNPLDKLTIERARKYAFHFFFRRMIPLEFVKPGSKALFKIKLSELRELMPGSSKGLDVICDGILSGSDFIYPEETA
ncbi:MAG: capsule biosynthesis protein [Nitrospirae bacterium]|nr:capsule biosynthesis protein [Nitrospirota bacterium]